MSVQATAATTAPGIQPVPISSDMPPTLFVIVDTEEEFDWSAPFSRGNTSVRAMSKIDRLQTILDRRGICPTYCDRLSGVASAGWTCAARRVRERRTLPDRRAPASVGHPAARRRSDTDQQLRLPPGCGG
jgi:hypothetical protein